MIYLTTGANGAGKTLLTLRDVREQSLKENRPVYHNGRFELTADFDWKVIKVEDWQDAPDGAIFLFDECQNELPVRPASIPVPGYIKALAEHRRRGFDFYLITQHPLNIDSFVRRLIGAPGWHRHLKRVGGSNLVSVIQWASVNDQCQRTGSGATGTTTMVPFPKEVFGWYKSTSLDTAKVKIPFAAKMLVLVVLLVPLLGWYGWRTFNQRLPGSSGSAKPVGVVPLASGAGSRAVSGKVGAAAVSTPGEYMAQFQPRLEGLPHTAPRYDDLTKPTSVPFPAACVSMGDVCKCYTQQATVMDVKKPLCLQIVKFGYFNDWQQVAAAAGVAGVAGAPGAPGQAVALGAAPAARPDFVPGARLVPVPGHVGGENVPASAVELPVQHLRAPPAVGRPGPVQPAPGAA